MTTRQAFRAIVEQENEVSSMLHAKSAANGNDAQQVKKALGDRLNVLNQLPALAQNGDKKVMGPPKAAQVHTKKTETAQSDKENAAKPKCKEIVRQESLVLTKRTNIGKKIIHNSSLSASKTPVKIYDPDVNTKDNPQMVTEYIQDILAYLRDMEDRFPIKENFLTNMKINSKSRTTLINWLVEVHNNFGLELDTLHLCISIVDRYSQVNKTVERSFYQLVGAAALMLAAKYEEIYVPDISDFVYICDDAFTKKQLLQMELEIVRKLDFRMGWPLSIYFLRRYSKVALVKTEHHNLAKYILELALLQYKMAHVKPSLQAAAACCLSIAIINEIIDPLKVWTPTLIHYTKYKYSDFKEILVAFADIIVKAKTSQFDAVKQKYASSKYGKISLCFKLEGPLIRKLTLSPPSSRK